AAWSGVTVRTLHYYDEIGLLTPSGRTVRGYRLYREPDLLRLQSILVYRELGFSLRKIQSLLADPNHDREQALLEQRRLLVERREKAEDMLRSIDRALKVLKGDSKVDYERLFDGFDPARYEDEAQDRWGETDAYQESARRTKRYSEEDWKRIRTESDDLLRRIAGLMQRGVAPTNGLAMDLADEHRQQIDRWYYPCSRAMHAGLARMYVTDSRFAATIDKHGEGLTRYLVEAIQANAEAR
ncbi:MAG: MerR family transcriptional regulator, partial [Planctomycetota bacterium]